MDIIELTDDQARAAMRDGEVPEEIRGAAPAVAVIFTQDWCPRYASMHRWLSGLEDREDLAVYVFKYNLSDLFAEFMQFKERTWKNDRIPYLRYFRDGRFVHAGNHASQDEFFSILGL